MLSGVVLPELKQAPPLHVNRIDHSSDRDDHRTRQSHKCNIYLNVLFSITVTEILYVANAIVSCLSFRYLLADNF